MIIDKNSIIEIFNLAVENHKENKIEQAQNLYHKVLKLNPRHSETLNNLGVISLNLNEYQKANEYFRKAINAPVSAKATIGNSTRSIKKNHVPKTKETIIPILAANPLIPSIKLKALISRIITKMENKMLNHSASS